MTKDKNYKRFYKKSLEDKIRNIIYIMKFLNSIGGVDQVRKFFGELVPNELLQHEGPGDAKKWILKQMFKTSPTGTLQKLFSTVLSDNEWLIPLDCYETLEEGKELIKTKISCKYLKSLKKLAKKYKCDFDIQEYYCKNACNPLLKTVYSDVFIDFNVEFLDDGCIQTIKINKAAIQKKDKETIT
ncbi:MAG: hypothetical protein ACTSPY_14400 [Candidatus Helarchaeota archaeon]